MIFLFLFFFFRSVLSYFLYFMSAYLQPLFIKQYLSNISLSDFANLIIYRWRCMLYYRRRMLRTRVNKYWVSFNFHINFEYTIKVCKVVSRKSSKLFFSLASGLTSPVIRYFAPEDCMCAWISESCVIVKNDDHSKNNLGVNHDRKNNISSSNPHHYNNDHSTTRQ